MEVPNSFEGVYYKILGDIKEIGAKVSGLSDNIKSLDNDFKDHKKTIYDKFNNLNAQVEKVVSNVEAEQAIVQAEKDRINRETAEMDLKVKKSKRTQAVVGIVSGLVVTVVIIYSYLSK